MFKSLVGPSQWGHCLTMTKCGRSPTVWFTQNGWASAVDSICSSIIGWDCSGLGGVCAHWVLLFYIKYSSKIFLPYTPAWRRSKLGVSYASLTIDNGVSLEPAQFGSVSQLLSGVDVRHQSSTSQFLLDVLGRPRVDVLHSRLRRIRPAENDADLRRSDDVVQNDRLELWRDVLDNLETYDPVVSRQPQLRHREVEKANCATGRFLAERCSVKCIVSLHLRNNNNNNFIC